MDQIANRNSNTLHVKGPAAESEGTISDITDLPHDIFLLVISHLSPTESVLCRRVSQAWNAAFTSDDVSWNLMRWHFPRVREMRNAARAGRDRPAWTHVFPKVARRYFYLRSARPRLIEKIDISSQRQGGLFQEVEPWHRWLRWNDNVATFQDRDLSWCLDDGLLIYRDRGLGGYVAYDLETRRRFSVPFDGDGKTVRRLRLAHNTLVIEWCERWPYATLRNGEDIHRHFATAFDVRRATESESESDPADPSCAWEIRFRSEWKIDDIGLTVPIRDRFFSAHTATHYAVYIWQHTRPSGTEDPVEQLTVWNIEDASPYRPSEDPSDAYTPGPTQPQPRVIKRFAGHALEFLGVRQGVTPVLREIFLDEANVYVHEEAHRWLAGQHSSPSPPRNHHVRATGIPLAGVGPRWVDDCCADGDIHMSFCPRAGSAAAVRFADHHDHDHDHNHNHGDNRSNNYEPRGFDGTWPGRAPCWRHEEFPYLTVSDVVDARAGVRVVARRCFVMEALSSFVLPVIARSLRAESRFDSYSYSSSYSSSESGTRTESGTGAEAGAGSDYRHEVRFADDMWRQLLGKGQIVGDERWVAGEDRDGNITVMRF
ncbi:hypothetical protein F5Y12DRAFT_558827 [Xylaria sp. FL1777]|nr:hypothetical protein F5Y12DRAFT_558827 [Xylaria sp. FL1777]